MRKFTLEKDYYGEGKNIFSKKSAAIEPGLTVLVGCNGSGKTTFLLAVKEHLKREEIPYLFYDNLRDGGDTARQKAGFFGDISFLATAICASEGENISMNIGRFAYQIGVEIDKYINGRKRPQEIWILIDAADSGLSIDNVREMKQYLFSFIMEDCKKVGIKPYFLVSANEYELVRGEQCYDVARCEYVEFKAYDEYANFIMESRKRKERRR